MGHVGEKVTLGPGRLFSILLGRHQLPCPASHQSFQVLLVEHQLPGHMVKGPCQVHYLSDAAGFDLFYRAADSQGIGRMAKLGKRLGQSFRKGQDQQKMVGSLSGGERGRLHMAKTLLQGGNVLLLDEPSNDLDIETLRALEDALLEFAGCALVISHDRWFLDRICTHILAAEGDSQWFFFAGNYQEYEEDKRKRLGEEGAKPKRIRYKPIAR